MDTQAGFTLIELIVTLSIVALLLSIVVPHYAGRVSRAEEAVLRENLLLMRDALDKHYSDVGKYPEALGDLVSKRYLRSIPSDPFTRRPDTWLVVAPPSPQGASGIFDVRSGSPATGSDGRPYAEW
ncbi:MAG TPA: prepilin-type N-terminal cleavage/methylation domain-containing protein [Burkholderiales bacterium]|nr:prepilin-type N-terminal cleavage/methylation domain-containing protein [Burkholderiales bacterium]